MNRIVLATGNPGKIREIKEILSLPAINVLSQATFDIPQAEETGLSFVENAILKARHAAHYTGLPAIADDSGLVVDALEGKPGIFSARYAGNQASDQENVEKLLANLAPIPDSQRTACFYCATVYLHHPKDPIPVIAQGIWTGTITRTPRGEGGFGYDPVFWVPAEGKTAAELSAAAKNRLSHRGQALTELARLMRQSAYLSGEIDKG